jgi:hypothetical protein
MSERNELKRRISDVSFVMSSEVETSGRQRDGWCDRGRIPPLTSFGRNDNLHADIDSLARPDVMKKAGNYDS